MDSNAVEMNNPLDLFQKTLISAGVQAVQSPVVQSNTASETLHPMALAVRSQSQNDAHSSDSHSAATLLSRTNSPIPIDDTMIARRTEIVDADSVTQPISRKRLRDEEETDSDGSVLSNTRCERGSRNVVPKFKSLLAGTETPPNERSDSPSRLASLLTASVSISAARSVAGTPTASPIKTPKLDIYHPRASTRPSTPLSNTSKDSTKWAFTNTRYSTRSASTRAPEVRPLGPRHLEYDYTEARKEFQSAAYYALAKCGYVPPKTSLWGKSPSSSLSPTRSARAMKKLPTMNQMKEVPAFRRACEKLDRADMALEDALARGQTWENTPVPAEYSLAALNAEDLIVGEPVGPFSADDMTILDNGDPSTSGTATMATTAAVATDEDDSDMKSEVQGISDTVAEVPQGDSEPVSAATPEEIEEEIQKDEGNNDNALSNTSTLADVLGPEEKIILEPSYFLDSLSTCSSLSPPPTRSCSPMSEEAAVTRSSSVLSEIVSASEKSLSEERSPAPPVIKRSSARLRGRPQVKTKAKKN